MKEKFKVSNFLAVLIVLYHLYIAFIGVQEPLIHRSFSVAFFFCLFFIMKLEDKKEPLVFRFFDIIFIVFSLMSATHVFLNLERLLTRFPMASPVTNGDALFGALLIVMTVFAIYRSLGPPLAIIVSVFIMYIFVGPYIPGIFKYDGYTMKRFLDYIYLSLDGIYGSPIAAASTYVFMFVVFGAFLSTSGAGEYFINLANYFTGKSVGGPAKLAVLSSCLTGSIIGSSTANVVITGSFTIPLMKKNGFDSVNAGAIEAVASTGGGIMPPVMGVAAFIMAEMTGIPYIEIIKAALLPAILYYLGLLFIVHFYALKNNLRGALREETPTFISILKNSYFLIPFVALIVLLLRGFSPSSVALFALLFAVVITFVFNAELRSIKRYGEVLYNSMVMGAKMCVPIVLACAGAGIVIAAISLTGIGGKLMAIVISVASSTLVFAMLISMVACLILGMGTPVVAAYILTAVLATPVMIRLGVPMISAHLFTIYYACLSAITPPVAVAAYAAAGIAEVNPTKVGWAAFKVGLIGLTVPFMFIYNPPLLLIGTPVEIVFALLSCGIAVLGMAVALSGWFKTRIHFIERLAIFVGGLLVMTSSSYFNVLSMFIVGICLLFNFLRFRKESFSEGKGMRT